MGAISPFGFARHEARLMWRDFAAMLTAGRTYRGPLVLVVAVLVYGAIHLLAHAVISAHIGRGISPSLATYVVVSGLLAMLFSLIVSQAIESVTRVYFGRSDLDLIISSPAPVSKLFAVRAIVIALQTAGLSLAIASPVINVVAWHSGAQVLFAYPLIALLAVLGVAIASMVALLLLRAFGPSRARLIAQVVAALVGAGFVVALQGFAIAAGAGLDRIAILTDPSTIAAAAAINSWWWLPARAAIGDVPALLTLGVGAIAVFAVAAIVAARRFGGDALRAGEIAHAVKRPDAFRGFSRSPHVGRALRSKEWLLLKRDPWLLSQSLQQILYMLPPALLLFFTYGEDRSVLFVVVPVIVMAVGQLSGGLAWLAISGEDAAELIETAPVSPGRVLWSKVHAVAGIVFWLVVPIALALAPLSMKAAFLTLLGAGAAATSATLVQVWFRSQANRSFFRRRQVSSRVATICEALVSISCATIACLIMADLWAILLAPPIALLAATLAMAWMLKPPRAG